MNFSSGMKCCVNSKYSNSSDNFNRLSIQFQISFFIFIKSKLDEASDNIVADCSFEDTWSFVEEIEIELEAPDEIAVAA